MIPTAYPAAVAAVLFPVAMIYAGLMDVMTMKIRNSLVAILAGAFLVLAPLAGFSLQQVGLHLAVAACVLIVAFSLFALGWIGGGDAKLAAAATLWLGPADSLPFLFYTTLLGGVLTLLLLSVRRVPLPASLYRVAWVMKLHDAKSGVPYGAAMAPAALLVFPQTLWLSILSQSIN